ncbi:MAG: hypothetical protein ACYTKD_12785 [Planctomycetota bacterium]
MTRAARAASLPLAVLLAAASCRERAAPAPARAGTRGQAHDDAPVGVQTDAPADIPTDARTKALRSKAALSGSFPQAFVFRLDYHKPSNRSYEIWSGFNELSAGVIKKYIREELPRVPPEAAEWARRFGAGHPSHLMLVHLNGEARQVRDFPGVHERYFPGHWVYLPGARLEEDVDGDGDERATTFRVADTSPFRLKGYRDPREKLWYPHDAVIVRTGPGGERLWYESEFVRLKAVDKGRGTITVERAQCFSKARAFKRGAAYVAPLAGGVWGGKPMWFYNFSTRCPRDREGRSAADAFTDEIAGLFSTGGALHGQDGIAFDVVHWQTRGAWDTDNDGAADRGIVDGSNEWRRGNWEFLKGLRERLGDGVIITADGHQPDSQRAVGVLDGLESEGPVTHIDAFRGFSRPVNIHTYWREHGGRRFDFRYIVLKMKSAADAGNAFRLRRFAVGAATCLGAAVTRDTLTDRHSMPELIGGPERRGGWLGRPAGAMVRLASRTDDLLAGEGERMTAGFVEELKADGCRIERSNAGGLVVTGTSADTHAPYRISLPTPKLPRGDLTVYVECRAVDPLEGFELADAVPRMVTMTASGLPDFGEGKRLNSFHATQYGLAGTRGWSRLSFYFRRAGDADRPPVLTLELEEQGRFAIRSITMHAAAAALAREFERGVVLVNPGLAPMSFDVATLFPRTRALSRLRVASMSDIDTPFLPDGARGGGPLAPELERRILEEYDGRRPPDLSRVEVGPEDALFLRKE